MHDASMRPPFLMVMSIVVVTCAIGTRPAHGWTAPIGPPPSNGSTTTPTAGSTAPTAGPASTTASVRRNPPSTAKSTESPSPSQSAAAAAKPASSSAVPPAANPANTSAALPLDAAGALERARAAYEYGDIDEMVESARQVADGRLRPSPAERASALRYLGIGLFLTGRTEGAETAFFELLRLRPESHLDPQNTRPDAVAFFEQVRRRYAEPIRDAARARNRKTFAWNFLPPAGQIQNGHSSRAIIIGGIELASLGISITSYAVLKHWRGPDDTFTGHDYQARFTRGVNWIADTVLVATFLYGIIDGIAHYADPQDETPTPPGPSTAHHATFGLDGLVVNF